MRLSDFEYSLLEQIDNNRYIEYSTLQSLFPTEKRRFKTSISRFFNDGLLFYTTAQNDEDFLISHPFEEAGPFRFENNYHLLLTEAGHAILDERKHLKRNFLVPYIITTVIATAGIVVSALDFYFTHFCC